MKIASSGNEKKDSKVHILPPFYVLALFLQKSGLSWEYIQGLYIVECWFYYADYINSLQEKKDIFYISD